MIKERILTMFCFFINIYTIEKNNSMIYMLMWTTPDILPFDHMQMGQQYFINRKCYFQNCYFTNDKLYFKDVRDFDVVLFNVINLENSTVPVMRSKKQKYVFVSGETPAYYPISQYFDGFFNLTWTYKLKSDATWRYFVVRNKKGEIIGPKMNMHWMNVRDMKPTSKHIKSKLQTKQNAAAWIAAHCNTYGHREVFVQNLKNELENYGLTVDSFGLCGNAVCPRDSDECNALLEDKYYFYLSFENSLSEDYVSEKVLTALDHFVVPVVYGKANYTRFMPDGMYLNAIALGPQEVARIMYNAIYDKKKYYDFFKWHRYYKFHNPSENADSDEICAFCAFLNDKQQMAKTNTYTHITNFWVDLGYKKKIYGAFVLRYYKLKSNFLAQIIMDDIPTILDINNKFIAVQPHTINIKI